MNLFTAASKGEKNFVCAMYDQISMFDEIPQAPRDVKS